MDIIWGAFYTNSGAAATGLTVTVDIISINRSTGAEASVASGASMTEATNADGIYTYRQASADTSTYTYFAVATTAGTVDQADVAAVATFVEADAVQISSSAAAANSVEANIGNLDAAVTSRSSHSAADVWNNGTRTLSANTNLNDPTAAAIADAVWDETAADHAGAGSTGAALSSASAPSAASVADAVWDEATSGHNTAGTFGAKLLDLVDQSSVTVVTAVAGSMITVYTDSYWSFTVSGLGDTSGYETLLLTVKDTTSRTDANATLYLRSDTGLIAIDGSAPADAGNGALTNDGTGFTATVEMAETANMSAQQNLTWWLKGLDTTPDPDTATVIASGTFNVLASGVKATS